MQFLIISHTNSREKKCKRKDSTRSRKSHVIRINLRKEKINRKNANLFPQISVQGIQINLFDFYKALGHSPTIVKGIDFLRLQIIHSYMKLVHNQSYTNYKVLVLSKMTIMRLQSLFLFCRNRAKTCTFPYFFLYRTIYVENCFIAKEKCISKKSIKLNCLG